MIPNNTPRISTAPNNSPTYFLPCHISKLPNNKPHISTNLEERMNSIIPVLRFRTIPLIFI